MDKSWDLLDEIIPIPFVVIVFGSGESSESILIDVHSKWVDAGDSHIDTKVKFESVEEHGIGDVVRHHVGIGWTLTVEDFLDSIGNEDAFALGAGVWFTDVDGHLRT